MIIIEWIVDKIVLWRWKRYCDSFVKNGTSDDKTMKLYQKWSRIHRFALRLDKRKGTYKW